MTVDHGKKFGNKKSNVPPEKSLKDLPARNYFSCSRQRDIGNYFKDFKPFFQKSV